MRAGVQCGLLLGDKQEAGPNSETDKGKQAKARVVVVVQQERQRNKVLVLALTQSNQGTRHQKTRESRSTGERRELR